MELCNWPAPILPSHNLMYDNTSKALELINSLNVTYILTYGSLLAAYRHGGPFRGLTDLDVVYPVWLNGMATCRDAKSYNFPKNRKVNRTWTLCGESRKTYVIKVLRMIGNKIGFKKIRPHPISLGSNNELGGVRIEYEHFRIDFVVSTFDIDLAIAGPICKCMYGNISALCYARPSIALQRMYGPQWKVPD